MIASSSGGSAVGAILLIVLYFLPTIAVFWLRRRTPGPVVVINLFLGWTVIGWVIALAMAFSSDATTPTRDRPPETPPPGWYPYGDGTRWWNGTAWTDSTPAAPDKHRAN